MHYLSQSISRNFLKQGSPQTFYEYDYTDGVFRTKNIKRLFASYKPWGQVFETILSGKLYEDSLAPLLRDLSSLPIEKYHVIGKNSMEERQFNGIPIENENQVNLLNKLILQTVLFQRSNESPDSKTEDMLSQIYASHFDLGYKIALLEINPLYPSQPMLLIDNMPFIFLCPDTKKANSRHACFMFPISERRFLLWVSFGQDIDFFCMKYRNITYLNLCRIEQQNFQCRIALAQNTHNQNYLKFLVASSKNFNSHELNPISAQRDWI